MNEFIEKIALIMQREAFKNGYSVVSASIAQVCIESNFGKSKLSQPPNYNFVGMKCGNYWLSQGKPYVEMQTKEEVNHKLITVSAKFRRYSSLEDGLLGYYDFIGTNRYQALKQCSNYIEFSRKIKELGYATSSEYSNTLIKFVEKYNLTKYDKCYSYNIGKTYVTLANLYVRQKPNGNKLKYDCITENAKKCAHFDTEGCAILDSGTRVTCLEIKEVDKQTWVRIPSGWICAINGDKYYI